MVGCVSTVEILQVPRTCHRCRWTHCTPGASWSVVYPRVGCGIKRQERRKRGQVGERSSCHRSLHHPPFPSFARLLAWKRPDPRSRDGSGREEMAYRQWDFQFLSIPSISSHTITCSVRITPVRDKIWHVRNKSGEGLAHAFAFLWTSSRLAESHRYPLGPALSSLGKSFIFISCPILPTLQSIFMDRMWLQRAKSGILLGR